MNLVQQPRLPAAPGHQEIGLISGLAMKGDRVVVFQLSKSKALHDQPDFCRADHADGHPKVKNHQKDDDKQVVVLAENS